MKRSDRWAAGVLVLVAVLVLVGVDAAPERDYLTGMWPIGLATGAVVLASPRAVPVVLVAVGVIGWLAAVEADAPTGVAGGYGLAAAVEAGLAGTLLRRPDRSPPRLRTDKDLRRYLRAISVAVAVSTAVVVLTGLVADYGTPGRVALGVGASHLASQLVFVPLFLRLRLLGAIAGTGERVAQWLVLLAGGAVIVLPDSSSSLVFLLMPILAWASLRITPLESVVQMLGVMATLGLLTARDDGPFAESVSSTTLGLPGEDQGIVFSAFAIACAVIVVPAILRVGEFVGAATVASADRDLVRGIVDGATGVAIIGTDEVGRITLFNPGAERMLGYRAEEVLGRSTTFLTPESSIVAKAAELEVPPEHLEVAFALIERRLVGSSLGLQRKDGVVRTHAVTITAVNDDQGRVSGYVSTSEDITDQLVAQERLRDALEAERRAVERLRDVDVVKDRFISTVSHELRTPITSIVGYLEMLSDGTFGALDDRQSDALDRVQANTHRLLALINDLLTLSRVAEQGLQVSADLFDLRAAVETAHAVVAPSWSPRRLDVTLALPEVPVPAYGDREMVERVVVNLLGNAVKFTEDGGSVRVSLTREGATSELLVSDTGIGIPEHEHSQLFTRFFRSSLAEGRAIPGTGLGLSITQAIVQQHGGTIRVDSRPGHGTSVAVRLPARPGMFTIQPPLLD